MNIASSRPTDAIKKYCNIYNEIFDVIILIMVSLKIIPKTFNHRCESANDLVVD